jgi:hypothetical protein
VNVRSREPDDKAKFTELLFDPEESQVIGFDRGEFFGGILQSERKQRDFRAIDILREIGVGIFHGHARFFSLNDSGRILKPVKNVLVDLLHNIINRDESAGILKQQQ